VDDSSITNKQIFVILYFKKKIVAQMDLTEKDKNQIIELNKAGKNCPKITSINSLPMSKMFPCLGTAEKKILLTSLYPSTA
jgi:hypothetical protein